ncbi:MAG: polysaccharide pyruvyl transferase family protein [Bacteroidaceae bacterium]|nr:polysaccharide pyruvyl transferase family protein [Bacteroidaceae bacterium]
MKVEIITLHRITNFGSMLQTYATQTAIEKLGHEAEVLDFVPEGISFKRGCWPKNNVPAWKKLIKLPPLFVVNLIEYHDVNRFLRKYIHLSRKRYSCYQDIINDIPLADAYLSGSDQVWNTQNNNPPEDLKAYYLGFAPEGKKRIAYAGSFGKNSFTPEEEAIIKEYIAKYDHISVREDDGLKILHQFGFDKGVHVVDPTLLLRGDDWRKFASVKNAPKPGYVFVYNLNRNGLIKEVAQAIAKEKGLRIINFADTFDFIKGAENRFGNSAEDFVNHIAHADYVVTDSFHGTAFSLNLNRQVIVVKAPRYNSRIESILRIAGLLDTRLVGSVTEGLMAASSSIDYQLVNPRIGEVRKKSHEYLKNSLS